MTTLVGVGLGIAADGSRLLRLDPRQPTKRHTTHRRNNRPACSSSINIVRAQHSGSRRATVLPGLSGTRNIHRSLMPSIAKKRSNAGDAPGKIALIETANPQWLGLWDALNDALPPDAAYVEPHPPHRAPPPLTVIPGGVKRSGAETRDPGDLALQFATADAAPGPLDPGSSLRYATLPSGMTVVVGVR